MSVLPYNTPVSLKVVLERLINPYRKEIRFMATKDIESTLKLYFLEPL